MFSRTKKTNKEKLIIKIKKKQAQVKALEEDIIKMGKLALKDGKLQKVKEEPAAPAPEPQNKELPQMPAPAPGVPGMPSVKEQQPQMNNALADLDKARAEQLRKAQEAEELKYQEDAIRAQNLAYHQQMEEERMRQQMYGQAPMPQAPQQQAPQGYPQQAPQPQYEEPQYQEPQQVHPQGYPQQVPQQMPPQQMSGQVVAIKVVLANGQEMVPQIPVEQIEDFANDLAECIDNKTSFSIDNITFNGAYVHHYEVLE